jgi:hypothetical protein
MVQTCHHSFLFLSSVVFPLLGINTLDLNLKDLKAMDRKEIIRNNNCCEGKRQQIILHIANLKCFP